MANDHMKTVFAHAGNMGMQRSGKTMECGEWTS